MTIIAILLVTSAALVCAIVPAYRPLIDTASGRIVLALAMAFAVFGPCALWLLALGAAAFLAGLWVGLNWSPRYDFSYAPVITARLNWGYWRLNAMVEGIG